MFTVSTIIPAYNAQSSIIGCLDSVRNQTYPIEEIIVVDDGSTDDTAKIIENYIEAHPKAGIKLIRQKNSGPSVARNVGIDSCRGSFIAFLDSDDQFLPQKIEKQMAAFKNNVDVVLVGCLFDPDQLKTISSQNKEMQLISFRDLLWKNQFSSSTSIVKKESLKELRFNEDQSYSEDYDLWLKISLRGKCLLLNVVLTTLADKRVYGDHGLSSKLWSMEKGELKNFKSLYSLGHINRSVYYFFSSYSFLKYIRREVVSKNFFRKQS